MMKLQALITALALTAVIALPSQAAVIAEGSVSDGYYWQLLSSSKGNRWLCRSVNSAKFQAYAKCHAVGAVKP